METMSCARCSAMSCIMCHALHRHHHYWTQVANAQGLSTFSVLKMNHVHYIVTLM